MKLKRIVLELKTGPIHSASLSMDLALQREFREWEELPMFVGG
ncbi:hypothetical protein ES703_69464 [subsurface metagenome]